jgi:hypothetical protein
LDDAIYTMLTSKDPEKSSKLDELVEVIATIMIVNPLIWLRRLHLPAGQIPAHRRQEQSA